MAIPFIMGAKRRDKEQIPLGPKYEKDPKALKFSVNMLQVFT